MYLLEQRAKLRTVDQSDVAPAGEAASSIRVAAGGDHKSTGSSLGRHDAIELAHDLHAHALRAPLLALNQMCLAIPLEHQIHAAVCTTATGFHHPIALAAKALAHQLLELLPTHAVERLGGFMATCRIEQARALATAPGRKTCAPRHRIGRRY